MTKALTSKQQQQFDEEEEEDYTGSYTTIVSVMPFPVLQEHKPMLAPSHYDINAAPLDGHSVTLIPDVIQYIPQLEHKMLTQPVLSKDLANSIVNDWANSQLQTSPPEIMPGLFVVNGEVDVDEVEEKYSSKLRHARDVHTNWSRALLTMADDLWAEKKSQRHISQSMRNAAKFLKVEREWLHLTRPDDFIKCPACTNQVPKEAIVCMNCRCILNPTKYKTLQFAEV